MGPGSRDFLQPLTADSLSNQDFPFGTAQTVEMGHGIARAHRVSFVGELGWELYVSTDQACHVFDALTDAGNEDRSGLPLLCGLHAMDSCRVEKGYRHYGHDHVLDHVLEDHVLEAGLGFAVKSGKEAGFAGRDFIGKDAVARKKGEGLSTRLLQFKLEDPNPLLFHI
jgi:4-methylaminobutanoate oxidase (formaldehyde-forming)